VGGDAGFGQLIEESLGIELIQGLGCRGVVELGDVAPSLQGLQCLGDVPDWDVGKVLGHLTRTELQAEAVLGFHEHVHHGDIQLGLLHHGIREDPQAAIRGCGSVLHHCPLL
jgi:hypothetical protein